MKSHNLHYLIVGTGGVGGSIAAFLKLAGADVACIARGRHLEAMNARGLVFHSDLKGEHTLQIPAYTAEEYMELVDEKGKRKSAAEQDDERNSAFGQEQEDYRPDVIVVCVKGYSLDSIAPLISRVAKPDTVVLPILNVYGTGPRIQRLCPRVTVLDGCIYIVGFVSGIGEISQMGQIFRLVFGAHPGTEAAYPGGAAALTARIGQVQADLSGAGIVTEISPDINRDTFVKWSFISAMALTGAYFDVPMGEVQKPGEVRDTFVGLTRESVALGEKLGIDFGKDMVAYNLKVIDSLDPQSTASMQKDLARGHQSEIQGLLFDMIAQAEAAGIDIPTYRMVEKKFKAYPEK